MHWEPGMNTCFILTTTVMDEMNRTMYNKIHRKAYDSTLVEVRDLLTERPVRWHSLGSLGKAAIDLCSYAIEQSKLRNSNQFAATLVNCWVGYEGDCWRGGNCMSTCGVGGYCCSKVKLEFNHDCPAGEVGNNFIGVLSTGIGPL